jgi:hypothetical protein
MTNWDDAAADALESIYDHTARTDTLAGVRSILNDFIDAEFGAADPADAQPWWRTLGADTLGLVAAQYPEARKYLTKYDVHALLIRKQRDYGHENINRFGRDGLLVRVHDKVARLENLAGRDAEPENEAVLDTLADIIGYSTIGIMVARNTFDLPLAENLT